MISLIRPRLNLLAIAVLACVFNLCPPVQAGGDPDLPRPIPLGGNVLFYDITIEQDGAKTQLWIYTPADVPEGSKLPCVLIAPAGTALWHGMSLGGGDRPEHTPWVEAGNVVVAYSISGALPAEWDDGDAMKALDAFLKADGGVANAKAALDYAIAKVKEVDKKKVYTVGHSSAATLAIQVAQADSRIKRCVAFAPATDLETHLEETADIFASEYKETRLKKWSAKYSPLTRAKKLKCPIFLFHAEDDENISIEETRKFEQALVKAGRKEVKLVTTESGGHYQSMIDEGMPTAVMWVIE